MNAPCCNLHSFASRQQVAKSNELTLTRCACGRYWLEQNGSSRVATETEQAIADIVTALARLKLPGVLATTR